MNFETIKSSFASQVMPVLLLCDLNTDTEYQDEQQRVSIIIDQCRKNFIDYHVKPRKEKVIRAVQNSSFDEDLTPYENDAHYGNFQPILEGLLHRYSELFPNVEYDLKIPLKYRDIQTDSSNIKAFKKALKKAESICFQVMSDGRKVVQVRYYEGGKSRNNKFLILERVNCYLNERIFTRVFTELLNINITSMGDVITFNQTNEHFSDIKDIILHELPNTADRNDSRSCYVDFAMRCSELYSFICKHKEILPTYIPMKRAAGLLICDLLDLNFFTETQKDRFIEYLFPA